MVAAELEEIFFTEVAPESENIGIRYSQNELLEHSRINHAGYLSNCRNHDREESVIRQRSVQRVIKWLRAPPGGRDAGLDPHGPRRGRSKRTDGRREREADLACLFRGRSRG